MPIVRIKKDCEHRQMRLELLNDNGHLQPDAAILIHAHAVYPDDPDSRRQAFLLAKDEEARYRRLGGMPHWSPSNFSETMLVAINETAGQRAVAGYTCIAFALLKAKAPDSEPTLYSAAKVVERALKKASQDDPRPIKLANIKAGNWEVEGSRCPNTRKGIETAWIKYSSVSHIIAADSILAEWFPLTPVFDQPPERTITLLKTASIFEPFIVHPSMLRCRSVSEVRHQFRGKLESLPTLPLGSATMRFFEVGLDAGR